jgi:nitroreductase
VDVFEATRTVLAVRQFQPTPVPEDTVRKIVEAGRLTGSASNRQPWHFVVVDDPHLIGELASVASTGPYTADVPLAVVVAIDKEIRFAVSDASRAIQSMVLAAWEDGIGSNWVGFTGMLENVNQVLGIPDSLDVLAILPFGYPTRPGGKGKKKRKAMAEVVHHNRFGQPFE